MQAAAINFDYYITQLFGEKYSINDKLSLARELEDQIDLFRKNLKKLARKRLEGGADVKAELLYIDLVRQIEKIGDNCFSISESLRAL